MKAYINQVLSTSDISDFSTNKSELIELCGCDCVKSELYKSLYSYFATKIHNTYPKYSHMNSYGRNIAMSKIDGMIKNKVEKLMA